MKQINKITNAPEAWLPFAEKLNEVIGALNGLRSLRGVRPLKVVMAEGGSMITIDLPELVKVIQGAGVGGGGGGGGGIPSELHNEVGTQTMDIGDAGFKLTYDTSGSYVEVSSASVLKVYNGANGKALTINPSSITRDMGIQTLTICDGVTQKSQDFVASAAY